MKHMVREYMDCQTNVGVKNQRMQVSSKTKKCLVKP